MEYDLCRLEDHFDGLEISLIEEAQGGNESHASAFWQSYLHRMFPRPWQLLCEQPPDDSRRRVDIKVIYYDSTYGTKSPVLYVELKRKTGSLKVVEEQGLDAAIRAIDNNNLTAMYIITARGVKYRAWYVTRQDRVLDPLHGSSQPATDWEYLDVRYEGGIFELEETIRLIKGEPPMRRAPVVPSQHAEMQQQLQTQMNYNQGEGSAAYEHNMDQVTSGEYSSGMGSWEQPLMDYQQTEVTQTTSASDVHSWNPTATYADATIQETEALERMSMDAQGVAEQEVGEDSSVEDGGIEPSEAGRESKGKGKKKRKERREVKVKRIPHTVRTDEIEFQSADGKTKTTKKDEWEKKQRDGHTVYEYRDRRFIYWCKHLR